MYHRPDSIRYASPGVAAFIRTLIDRPDLAESVKEVFPRYDDDWQTHFPEALNYLLGLASDMKLGLPNDPDLRITKSEEFSGTFVRDLLLSFAPKIETLQLNLFLDFWDEISEKPEVSWLDNRAEPALPHLRRLRIDPDDTNGYMINLYEIGALLRAAPNLEHICLWGANGVDDCDGEIDYDVEAFLPRLTDLRILELPALDFWPHEKDDNEFLHRLVAYSDRFECLRMWSEDRTKSGGAYFPLSPSTILPLLEKTKCKNTLKHVDFDLGRPLTEEHWEVRQPHVGSVIAKFPRLEVLKLDEQSFCRHWLDADKGGYDDNTRTCVTELIQPSLRILIVRTVEGSRVLPDILHLATEMAAGKFKHVQYIGVDIRRSRLSALASDELMEASRPMVTRMMELFDKTDARVCFLFRDFPRFREWRDRIGVNYDLRLGLLDGVPGKAKMEGYLSAERQDEMRMMVRW